MKIDVFIPFLARCLRSLGISAVKSNHRMLLRRDYASYTQLQTRRLRSFSIWGNWLELGKTLAKKPWHSLRHQCARPAELIQRSDRCASARPSNFPLHPRYLCLAAPQGLRQRQ
eukprot:2338592-Amphidinium_carterae.1